MTQSKKEIKVFVFNKDEPFSLPILNLKTVSTSASQIKDLKLILEKDTFIQSHDQKLVINKKVIKDSDQDMLQKLNLKETDNIILLTHQNKSLNEYNANRPKEKTKKAQKEMAPKGSFNGLMKQFSGKMNDQESIQKLMNATFTNDHLNAIARMIFGSNHWKAKEKNLLGQQGVLAFVLNKMSENNPNSKKIFSIMKSKAARMLMINEANINESEDQVQKTFDRKACQQLIKMGYKKENIIETLHKTSNNYYQSLQILSTGKEYRQFQIPTVSEQDQQMFIYRWLMEEQNKSLRVRLSMNPQYIQIWLNELKYRSPALFEIIKRKRGFVKRLLSKQNDEWIAIKREKKIGVVSN